MTTKKQRFNTLSWIILRAKYEYYILNDSHLTDDQYDALEREYDSLAKELNLEPTASNMVGFDMQRPSCQLVSGRHHETE